MALLRFLVLIILSFTCEGAFSEREVPELLAFADRNGRLIWSSKGTFGRYELSVYENTRPSNSWFLVGQRGQNNYGRLENTVLAFRDESTNKSALSPPIGFSMVYDTRGGTSYKKASLWRPLCKQGYKALGHFFHDEEMLTVAPKKLFERARCVREDLTTPCDWGVKIWDNWGAFGKYYSSIWGIKPRSNAENTGFFYGNNQHNERPNLTPICFRKNAFKII